MDERTSSIPVLAVTAQAMKGDRERFLEAGFDAYLSKPVDIDALLGTVEQQFRRDARSAAVGPGRPVDSSE
jgi:CheY-like chemotaxis protein